MSEAADMTEQTERADTKFWEELLHHIIEKGRRTPKVQVERAIGPILGFFLERAMSDLRGSEVKMLAAEFPLKQKNSNQSTNIDWLMYDKGSKVLLLVELKTDISSFRNAQFYTYLSLVSEHKTPWLYMKKGFNDISEASKSWKYGPAEDTLHKLLEAADIEPEELRYASAQVVYLAPEATRKSFESALKDFPTDDNSNIRNKVEFFFFKNLKLCADDEDNDDPVTYRNMLYKALYLLDEECEDEKLDDVIDPPNKSRENYKGRVSLEEILEKCKEDSSISVGFKGGRSQLKKQDFAHIEKRLFKWDKLDSEGKGVGEKNRKNWIKADVFVEIVEPICAEHLRDEEKEDVDRLAKGIADALRKNPKLTLGQLIVRAVSDPALTLEEIADDDLVKAMINLSQSN